MDKKDKIIIGDKIMTRAEFFARKDEFRKLQAGIPFCEKIKKLIELQEIALKWGGRKDIIVWSK